jgi:required for meiotic nuclear division protein 1
MKISFKAWYYRSTIDEEKVRRKFQEFTIEFFDPLVIKIDDIHRVMVTSFGAVVFFSFDDEISRIVSGRIVETLQDSMVVKEVEDRLIVETGKNEERFMHNEVWLKDDATMPTRMRIIAMLLAQSVALDYLEREADNALQGFQSYLDNLRERGRISIPTHKILQNIGFAMQTRFMVLNNVALFDKPAETWESESIENLYQGMYDFFDIAERQEVLAAKLDFISENTRMLFEVISSRKSHYLEWIVIILIAFEIIVLGAVEMMHALVAR